MERTESRAATVAHHVLETGKLDRHVEAEMSLKNADLLEPGVEGEVGEAQFRAQPIWSVLPRSGEGLALDKAQHFGQLGDDGCMQLVVEAVKKGLRPRMPRRLSANLTHMRARARSPSVESLGRKGRSAKDVVHVFAHHRRLPDEPCSVAQDRNLCPVGDSSRNHAGLFQTYRSRFREACHGFSRKRKPSAQGKRGKGAR